MLTETTGSVRVGELARRLWMTGVSARIAAFANADESRSEYDRAREGEGYVFGRKLLKFGRAAVYRSNIVEISRPLLTQLCNDTGHTALLSTPTRGGAMVILAVPSQFEPGILVHPGTVLSFPESPSARLIHYFEKQKPAPPNVRENLEKYQVDFEANARGNGLGGIAAPIFEPNGVIACAVGLILSSSLLIPEPSVALLESVRGTARQIQASYALGARSPLMPEPVPVRRSVRPRAKRALNPGFREQWKSKPS